MVKLQNPKDIILSGASRELLSQVTASYEALQPHRPFSPELESKLRDTLLPDRIVASLNIEGIVATRRQTLAVMDAMRINEAVGRGETEIRNALLADEFIYEQSHRGNRLSEQLMREVNRLLLQDIREDAGMFRAGAVELPGAPFPPPSPSDVPPLIKEICDLFHCGDDIHPVLQAAWLHEQFTLVHPFSDGNGRGGRILQDWALMRRGLMPVGISSSKRDDYYAALAEADNGKWDDLVEIIALLELSILSKIEAMVDERQRQNTWVKKLASAAANKRENTRHKQYLVWRKRMERVNQAFKNAVQELDSSSDLIGAAFKEYGVLEFRDWESVCKQGYIQQSWLFSIIFFAEGSPFYKVIAYLRRHAERPEDTFSLQSPQDAPVSLYLTGVPTGPDSAKPSFVNYADPHIRLREILFKEDEQFVYRQFHPEEDWKIDEMKSVPAVVEELFMDVFQRKAGLGG